MTNEVKVLKYQDKDFLLTKLADTIRRNEKHIDYDRVVELNTLYTQLITGENMDSLLKQFTPRESPELFRQRMRITQHITKTVSQNIMDIYQKIPRSNSVSRVVTYSDNNIAKLNEFNTKLNEFWGDESLDDYMATRWFELNFIDPNAFIVAEWLNVDTTKERYMPYPFEVSSKMAINYEYFNNDLIYLISEMPKSITYWDKKEKKDVTITIKEYTIYGANQTIKFKQLSPKESEQAWKDNKVAINAALREGIFIGPGSIPSHF